MDNLTKIYSYKSTGSIEESVVCPECCAAIGAPCTKKTLWGMNFQKSYHPSRLTLAIEVKKEK